MYKKYLVSLIVLIILVLVSLWYIDVLAEKGKKLQDNKYEILAKSMQEKLKTRILAKQKATLAMAISLANNEGLMNDIINKQIDNNYYKKLISQFNQETQYKNIWIHIVDKDLNSLYRSWSNFVDKDVAFIRPDLVAVKESGKVLNVCSSGIFGLTIKAIVPLKHGENLIGIIEIISHFNSISKKLKKFNTNSVVILKKEYNKNLLKPFTNIFIANDYYVANFDASPDLLTYLEQKGVEKYFNNSYKVDNKYLIVSHELKTFESEPLGYYIMLKDKKSIPNLELDYMMFKWFTFGIFLVLIILIVVIVFLFYKNTKEKKYYKNILDSSINIVVINNKKVILTVNRIFFKYFKHYKSIDQFKAKHNCICDFFLKEDGYLQKDMDGINWVDYLLANNHSDNKVKIKYYEAEYYFSISAALVSEEKNHYSIVLSDITKQENYKIELEYLTITDPLTGIKNRRYFNQRLAEETSKAKRYEHPLSLIMCDIDHFKKVNDIHGHAVGDNILIEYSKFIFTLIRDVDVFCRIGGEEFMIILPYSNKSNAMIIAEKLRAKVASYEKILPITMSFGVTQYVNCEDIEFLYKRVDDALYEAKEAGRNRVVVG